VGELQIAEVQIKCREFFQGISVDRYEFAALNNQLFPSDRFPTLHASRQGQPYSTGRLTRIYRGLARTDKPNRGGNFGRRSPSKR
jgi:hypothetical protein